MIRCNKCGFPGNRDDAKRCIKCNTPLTAEAAPAPEPAPVRGVATLPERPLERPPLDAPKPAAKPAPAADPGQTRLVALGGLREKSYALVALSPDMQQELRAVPISGASVVLKRETLDAGNVSLSRDGQASLVNKNGEWWIENLSKLKSTFVQVNRPLKLADGDVIQMGDTLYRFKENG